MRLDGSLEDFELPDVLQLLAQTRKSGALHLHATGDERRGLIRVGTGAVNGASSDLRRHALARRLIGTGLVSDEALNGAAEDVRAGAPSLVRALLDRAAVEHDDVTRLAADQATDAVCELLRWSSGTFSFVVGEQDPDSLELGLRAEELVAEGQRRMQVWPTLTAHIPSPDSVLRLATAPSFDPSCTREEWGLLALVDGSRSVSEIVALLGRSEFGVAGALAALVERGLLTVSADGSGLADLQRRQDIIAAMEGHRTSPPAPEAHEVSAPSAPLEAPAAEVPHARAETSVAEPASFSEDFASPAATPGSITSQTRSYEQPLTQGSAALDPAHDISYAPAYEPEHQQGSYQPPQVPVSEPPRAGPESTARGLDSAVTKSLVLRLIAGVRGL